MPRAHFTRIESRVGLGIPDCVAAIGERFTLIELKVVTSGRRIRLSPHQVAFHLKHAHIGAPTFFLVEYHPPASSAKKPQILLYEGKMAEDILTHGVDTKTALTADLTPYGWNRVFEVLCDRLK